jgi:predicted TIM-barrel fold metal-dependent hydrolase
MSAAQPQGRIDTHHHILPPGYLAQGRDEVARVAGDFAAQVLAWTPQGSLDAMDQAGVRTAVTSISSPGLGFAGAHAPALARECNEYAASLAADHPGRFASFAALPLPDVDAALAELDHAADTLHAQGFGLYTSYDGKWLGDAAFAPLFDELNRRSAVVFVHPLACPQCADLLPGVPDAIMEYPFDTTRAIASLLYAGTLSRCPRIRFIFSHGGGTLPMLAHRIARYATVNREIGARVPDAGADLARLHFDVVSVAHPAAFEPLRALAGVERLVFGSDYPYWTPQMTANGLASLRLDAKALSAIESGNALRLMPGLSEGRHLAAESAR